jgi:hypothetical protein
VPVACATDSYEWCLASTYASIASVIASPALRGFPISHLPVTAYMTVAGGFAAGSGVLAGARWGRNKLSVTTKARIFDSTLSA